MSRAREVAKFFCGFEACHMLCHAFLWLSDTTITAFGITAMPTLNIVSVILHAGIALVPGLYGWGADRRGSRAPARP